MKNKEQKKGQHGGECNRTACKNENAQWYNKVTEAFYCTKCARMINESSNQSNQGDLCELKREEDTNTNSELTNKEILQKAIEKAMDNGYLKFKDKNEFLVMDGLNDYIQKIKFLGSSSAEVDYQSIIFSHDFAKAFWGEGASDTYWVGCGIRVMSRDDKPPFPIWKLRLQQMAVEKDRIDFLRKFIN